MLGDRWAVVRSVAGIGIGLFMLALTGSGVLAQSASPLAVAPPFERLPDGRIGVEIFGQRVGLPATDVDLDRIDFYPLRARPFGEKSALFTLRQALAEPDKARLAFEQEPEWVSIRITTDWPADGKPVLGLFDRQSVPLSSVANPLTINIQRAPDTHPPQRGTWLGRWSSEPTGPDEDGYFVRLGVIPPRQKETDETGYRLSAAQRLWPTGVDLIVICRWVGAPVRECGQTQQTQDGRISISWSWDEGSFHTPQGWYENYFPKPRWKELDLRLHEVAEYLLLNKPSGELE